MPPDGRVTLNTVPTPATRARETPGFPPSRPVSVRLSWCSDVLTDGSHAPSQVVDPHGCTPGALCWVWSKPCPSPCEPPDSSDASDRLSRCPGRLISGDGEKAAEMPVLVRRIGTLLKECHSSELERCGRNACGTSASLTGSSGGSRVELMTCMRLELGLLSHDAAVVVTHRPSEMSAADVTAMALALRRPCGISGSSACRCASADASCTMRCLSRQHSR